MTRIPSERAELQMTGNKTIYLETGSTDPAYNLAFEEYVLRQRTDRPYLLLWQNDNTIVVGQNQNTEAEINRSFVEPTASGSCGVLPAAAQSTMI